MIISRILTGDWQEDKPELLGISFFSHLLSSLTPKTMGRLDGKVIIVTGAGAGFGRGVSFETKKKVTSRSEAYSHRVLGGVAHREIDRQTLMMAIF